MVGVSGEIIDGSAGEDAGAAGHISYCCCASCDEDAGDHGFNAGPLLFPDPTGDEAGLVGTDADNGKPIISAFHAAGLIARSPLTWAVDGDLNVTFAFATDATAGIGYEEFTEANKAFARDVLALYADVSGLTVTEVTPNENPDFMLRVESDTANGGGFFDGSFITVGNVSFEPVAEPGTYLFNLLLHEAGHAFGLSHPGDYNGSGFTYGNDADFFSDSAQFTNLSYFSEQNTGADFGFLTTLGLHDILAIQMEYGANMSARTGNTTYGYNNNSGLGVYDLSPNDGRGFSIWDADGTDTLDFSGSSFGTELDLREGAFSSVNGDVGNVSIAYGATIENGIGSSGNDLIRGNDVANVLRGGAGNDTIIGGADVAPSTAADPRDFVGVQLNADPLTFDQALVAENIDGISGGQLTIEMMVQIDRTPQDDVVFASYAVPGQDDEFLIRGVVGGNLQILIAGFPFDSGIPTASLVDGDPHRLSVTWDNSNGELQIFIDGARVLRGAHRPGETLDAGGTFVVGQDQDIIGGAFQPFQILQGTVGDIRIFTDKRTNAEIADNAFTALTGNEQGLAHYWRADGASGSALDDRAGSASLAIVNGGTINNTAGGTGPLPDDGDTLLGEDGDDLLQGGWGNDRLEGGDGDDTLQGGSGNDLLLGSSGNDTLDGGSGDDTLNGGAGTDTFSGGGGDDVINTGAGSDEAGGGEGDDTLNGQGGNDVLNGGGGDDIVNGAGGNDDVKGGQGDDIVRGGVGNDDLGGSDGNDQLLGQADDDTLKGGAGDDLLNGAAGEDALNGGAGDDILNGGSQNDLLIGGTGDDQLRGQAGADRMEGGGGADVLNGASGADLLFGGAGADTLNGGAGNDTLFGGIGDDTLNGQGGIDRYVFNASEAGNDTVVSLAAGETVHLLGFGFASAASAAPSFSQSGRDVVFASGDVSIRFTNAELADVRAAVSLSNPPASSPEVFDFSGFNGGSEAGPAGEIVDAVPKSVASAPAPVGDWGESDLWAIHDLTEFAEDLLA